MGHLGTTLGIRFRAYVFLKKPRTFADDFSMKRKTPDEVKSINEKQKRKQNLSSISHGCIIETDHVEAAMSYQMQAHMVNNQ